MELPSKMISKKTPSKNATASNPIIYIVIVVIVLSVLSVQMSLLTECAKAFLVKVGVTKILDAEITSFYSNTSTNLVKFNVEIRNKGSIAYSSRVRIDLLNISSVYEADKAQELFTAWSPEREMMPGDRKNIELYWYNVEDDSADFRIRARVYYGNEILEKFYDMENLSTLVDSQLKEGEGVFKISGFRVYDKFVIFDLASKKDIEDVVIIPASFTRGWIFEQQKIGKLKSRWPKTVILPYETPVFAQDNLTIEVVSEDPNSYLQETLTLNKDKSLRRLVFSIVDRVRLFLSLRH